MTALVDGKACPRCKATNTQQRTNFGRPMEGRFLCLTCKRTWDETDLGAPDYVAPEAPSENIIIQVKMTRKVFQKLRSAMTVRALAGMTMGPTDAFSAMVLEAIDEGKTDVVIESKKS